MNCSALYNIISSKRNVLLNRYKLSHYPRFLMVEPTNTCNLSCPLCPTGNNELNVPSGFMDYTSYTKLIVELKSYLQTILLWGFGEPLLHPDIYAMIQFASMYSIETKISTNGQLFGDKYRCADLIRSGLTQLRVSLDGLSDETLSVYRKGASFELIDSGIRQILDLKNSLRRKNPFLLLQFIVMKHNEHEIPALKKYAQSLGVAWRLKTVSLGSDEPNCDDGSYLPDLGKSRYKCDAETGKLVALKRRPKICPYPWLWGHINWDGSVVPCCKDPHRMHYMGNAFSNEGFKGVWNNNNFTEFRKKYLVNPLSLKRCKKCDHPFK